MVTIWVVGTERGRAVARAASGIVKSSSQVGPSFKIKITKKIFFITKPQNIYFFL